MNSKRFELCPWCGESPKMEGFRFGNAVLYQVACNNEKCKIQPVTMPNKSMAQATRDWNRRAK